VTGDEFAESERLLISILSSAEEERKGRVEIARDVSTSLDMTWAY
jgi:hypothetical protein